MIAKEIKKGFPRCRYYTHRKSRGKEGRMFLSCISFRDGPFPAPPLRGIRPARRGRIRDALCFRMVFLVYGQLFREKIQLPGYLVQIFLRFRHVIQHGLTVLSQNLAAFLQRVLSFPGQLDKAGDFRQRRGTWESEALLLCRIPPIDRVLRNLIIKGDLSFSSDIASMTDRAKIQRETVY